MRLAVAAALLLAALPVHADPAAEADAVASCMRDAWPRDPRRLCVGIISTPCQQDSSGAPSENLAECLAREASVWDGVMDQQMPELMRRALEIDATNPRSGDGIDSAAMALDIAQRAWLTYRDSEYHSAYASWGAEDFRTIAHAACLLDLTARRVVDFQARLVTGG